MSRWSKSGLLDRVFAQLQQTQIVRIKIEAISLDSTAVKVHPDGTGALKKMALNPLASPVQDGLPRFIGLPQMLEPPLVSISLRPSTRHSRRAQIDPPHWPTRLPYSSAHGLSRWGDGTRQLALDLGFIPVVPPKCNRIAPW